MKTSVLFASTLKVRNYLCIFLNSVLFDLFHLLDGFHILLLVFPKEDKVLHFTCKHKQILSISFLHRCFLCSSHWGVQLLQLTLLHIANEKQKLSKNNCNKPNLDLYNVLTGQEPYKYQMSCVSLLGCLNSVFPLTINSMLWQS